VVQSTPLLVPNLTGVTAAGGAVDFSLVVGSGGVVLGWGLNNGYNFGDGNLHSSPVITPIQAATLTGATSVGGGANSCLALRNDGTVYTWGDNSYGQTGYPKSSPYITKPNPVPGLSTMTAIAAGTNHCLAIKGDGTLWSWGSNSSGQLGYSTPLGYSDTALTVPGLTSMISVAGGVGHTIAAKSDGTVWSWGTGTNGQLGLEAVTSSASPAAVTGMTGTIAVAAGSSHSLALRNDGTVWAWGKNSSGQLGNGGTADANAPTSVQGLTDVIAVSAGESHSLALRTDGTVWSWGDNSLGQLGNLSSISSATPVPVLGLANIVSISCGPRHNLAVENNGTVWAWGSNSKSQIGFAAVNHSTVPVPLPQ
jgi:alpha-tubulin suppressor-like RCC1 family protein